MQHSQEASSRALAAYVEQARTALGPTLLQVCLAAAGTIGTASCLDCACGEAGFESLLSTHAE